MNCGNVFAGNFCNTCDQSADVRPFTFRIFAGELIRNLRKLDFSITFFTFVELITEPGEFIRHYLAGRRVGFVNPFKFYFYALILQVLLLGVLFRATGDEAFNNPLAADSHIQVLAIISTIFWGFFWRIFYHRSLKSVAEYAVCAVFFGGQNIFLGILITLLSAPFKEYIPWTSSYILWIQLLITAIYGCYFAKEIFQEPWWKIIFKQSLLLVIYAVILSVMIVSYGIWVMQVSE